MAISGLKFPLEITSLGRFGISTEKDKIRQNVEAIASTAMRERWYEPNMGTLGYALLFMNITQDTIRQAINLVQNALNEQEPRITAQVTAEQTDVNTLEFTVKYFWKKRQTFDVTTFDISGGI